MDDTERALYRLDERVTQLESALASLILQVGALAKASAELATVLADAAGRAK